MVKQQVHGGKNAFAISKCGSDTNDSLHTALMKLRLTRRNTPELANVLTSK